MEGVVYGAIIGIILVVVARLAGVRRPQGRAIVLDLLLTVVYFLVYLILQAVGVDAFWAIFVALAIMLALSLGIRRLRPDSFTTRRLT